MPSFQHVSLILAPDWSKLSKRHGATSVGQVVNLYCLNLYFMQKLGVIPSRHSRPAAYRLYLELLKRHAFTLKYQELTPDMSVKSSEETIMRQYMIKDIHDLLRGLDSGERQALFLHYGLKDNQPKSLDESGRLLCVTKEWIRKIEKKLRDEDICRNLSHYLDL